MRNTLENLTPAAQRALAASATWCGRAGSPQVESCHLLLGLFDEPECRAATTLAACGIDPTAVLAHWPQPNESGGDIADRPGLSPEVESGLAEVRTWLADHPAPRVLATEHLLLGLLLAGDDVACWLLQQGVHRERLEQDIRRRAGQELSGVPIDMPEDTLAPPTAAAPKLLGPMGAPTVDRRAALRIVDAAANRAREGLRVVEDYVRLALDDFQLTTGWKQLRHDLTAALARFDGRERLAARDTPADVGTRISTTSETRRDDLRDVAAASIARLQEALRSLEEYGKLFDPAVGASFEALRYRSYTLEQATLGRGAERSARLRISRLYVLLNGCRSLDAFESLATALIAAGIDVLQLRDKQLDDRSLLKRAQLLRRLTRPSATLFIMNDRADLAALADADGVHVGQDELTVADARRIMGADRLVGVSTHSIAQARAAALDGADYIGVGPTFPSSTKSFADFPGLPLLQAVAAEIRIPAFAIGGITADNLPHVLESGINRVAISAAIAQAADPTAAIATFRRLLG